MQGCQQENKIWAKPSYKYVNK